MAITLYQEPDLISPAFQPEFYLCYISYSIEQDFKYMFVVEDKDGDILNKKILPFPDYNGRMDISPILQNYVDSTFLYDTTGNTHTDSTLIQYEISIGYTGSTHTSTPVSQGVLYLLNGADLDFDYENYLFNSGGVETNYFLTHQPLEMEINLTDYYTLTGLAGNFLGGVSSFWHDTFIDVYYSDGTDKQYMMVCDGYAYAPGFTSPSAVGSMCQTAGVGPINLNDSILYDADLAVYTTGATIIHSGTTSYDIWIGGNSRNRYSPKYTFNVNNNDNRYPLEQVAFLNRLGNFSYFTFRGKTRVTTSNEKDTFIKNRYYLNGNSWETNSARRGRTTYNSNVRQEVTFQSDYINQDTYDFMEDLFTSPEVYWIKDGEAISMNVVDTTWSNKRKVNDKVIEFNIKCEFANKKLINI